MKDYHKNNLIMNNNRFLTDKEKLKLIYVKMV